MTDDRRREFARYLVNECGLTPSSAFTYEQSLRRLERSSGRTADELNVIDIRRFLRDSSYHPATKNATLVAIKAFHRFGALEGYWEQNGIAALRGPRQVRNPRPSLGLDEVRTVLGACSQELAVRVIYLGLYAGCRVSESARIGAEEWERPERLRFLGKGRKVRDVPVHPELEAVRDRILATRATADTLKHVVRSIAFYTGIPLTSHTLRRTFGVTLSEAGVSRDVIGALLGHAPATVTVAAYVPVRWSEMVEAVARLKY